MKDFNKILSDAYYVKMVGDPYFGIANTETVRNRIYALYNADKDTYCDEVSNLLNENKDQLINIMGCILSTEKSAKKLGISLTGLFKEIYNELQQPENDNTDNSNPEPTTATPTTIPTTATPTTIPTTATPKLRKSLSSLVEILMSISTLI